MGPLRTAVLALALATLAGCGTERAVTTRGATRAPAERLCAGANAAPGLRAPPGSVDAAAASRLATAGFSPAAIAAAQATGAATPLLRLAFRPGGAPAAQPLHDAVRDSVLLAMLDLASTIAEIDCEGERGDQLRGRLQARINRRTRHLGIAAVIVGAGTAALTGGLSLAGAATAADIAGIAGGSTEAGIAGALLLGEERGELRTPRNLLAEVWHRPEQPVIFPAPVWRYLTQPGPDGTSRRDALLAEWRVPELLGAPDSETERERAALLFGAGGSYSTELLEIREAMLDLLEASIRLMHHDLRALLSDYAAWRAGR